MYRRQEIWLLPKKLAGNKILFIIYDIEDRVGGGD